LRLGLARMQSDVTRLSQGGLEPLALLLRVLAFGDVFAHADNGLRATIAIPDLGHRQMEPAHLAAFVYEALLDDVAVVLARDHALELLPSSERVIWMGDL